MKKNEGSRLFLFSLIFLLLMSGARLLYLRFGYPLVESMYEGSSPLPFLNRIIEKQEVYPLTFYLAKADFVFNLFFLVSIFSLAFYLFLLLITAFFSRHPEGKRRITKSSLAMIFYGVFTYLCFLPVLGQLKTHIIGPPEDNMQHLWHLWWFERFIGGNSPDLFYSQMIFYPQGASLVFERFSLYNLLLGAFLIKFMPYTLVYNLLIMHSFIIAGLGAYFLIRYLSGNSYAALIGGFIYGFSPFHFAQSFHHLEISSLQFLPFFILFFLKSVREDSKKDLLFAVFFCLLNSLCSWYYFAYCLGFVFLTYAYLAWRNKKLFLRKILIRSLIVSLLPLLAVSPWLLRLLSAGLAHPEVALQLRGHRFLSTDIAALFVPHTYHWLSALRPLRVFNYLAFRVAPWERTVYLGIVNLLFFAMSCRIILKFYRKYLLGFMFFLLFSLGSALNIAGQTTSIILPYVAVEYLPFVQYLRMPSRLMVFVYLFLGIIVAFSIDYLMRHKATFKKITVLGAIFFAVCADYYLWCNQKTEFSLPFCYSAIKADVSVFGILDLPSDKYAWADGERYMMYQIMHRFPIVGGSIVPRINSSLLDYLDFKNFPRQQQQLQKAAVKYIVIHKRPLSHASLSKIDIAGYLSFYRAVYADANNVVLEVF